MADPFPDEASSSGSAKCPRSADLSLAVDDMIREVDMWRAESGRSVGDGGDGSMRWAAAVATAGVRAAVAAGSLRSSTGSDDSVVERGGGGIATHGSGGRGNDRLRDGGDSTFDLGEVEVLPATVLHRVQPRIRTVLAAAQRDDVLIGDSNIAGVSLGLGEEDWDAANKEEGDYDEASDGDFD